MQKRIDKETKSPARQFTELTAKDKNDVWHEEISGGRDYKKVCSCGLLLDDYIQKQLDRHIKESNPTYSHADEILNRMREKCGEEKYNTFINSTRIGIVRRVTDYPILLYKVFINEEFISNPSALLQKAVAFLKGE